MAINRASIYQRNEFIDDPQPEMGKLDDAATRYKGMGGEKEDKL